MMQSVPGIFDKIDYFASHSYPASHIGWGFNVPFSQAQAGLLYFQKELAQINKQNMTVLITETGWVCRPALLPCSLFLLQRRRIGKVCRVAVSNKRRIGRSWRIKHGSAIRVSSV